MSDSGLEDLVLIVATIWALLAATSCDLILP